MARNQRDNTQAEFSVTNWTEDVALDCNSTSDAELADVLATVINELIEAGILQGSVSA